MSDPFKLRVESEADLSGLEQFEARSNAIFEGVKQGIIDALKTEGASPEFIDTAVQGFNELQQELEATGGTAEEMAAKITALEQRLTGAAEAEQRRISQLKLGFEEALREKEVQEEALGVAKRRREEDQLHNELEELARKKRLAETRIQLELERSVAQARQMSAEQRITREVNAQGAYNPAEEVARLRAVEAQAGRTAAGVRGIGTNAGQAALQMSYFVDDMQYGLRGIMNNIPMLITSLGAGAGLAGVIGIAAVAVSVLWDKFGGAKKAKDDAEQLKEKMQEVKTAIENASTAANKAFQTSMETYLEQLREATQLWAQQKQNIQDAMRFAAEMAKAELEAGKARLEIGRQNELAQAKTQEQRDAINKRYDTAGGMLGASSNEEGLKRAEEAQRLEIESQKNRTADAEQARNQAQAGMGGLDAANQGIMGGVGQQSDQAIRRYEATKNQNEILGLEVRMRALLKEQEDAFDGTLGGRELDQIQKDISSREAELKKKYQERDSLNAVQSADEEALRTGKGVTFEGAKKAAEERGDGASLKAYTDAENALKNNTEARAKIQEAIAKADEEILKLKQEASAMEKQMLLLQAQQEAARLKADQETSKQDTAPPALDGFPRPLPTAPRGGVPLTPPPGLNGNPAPLPRYDPKAPVVPPPAPLGEGSLPGADAAASAMKEATAANQAGNEAVVKTMQAFVTEAAAMKSSQAALIAKVATLESQLRTARA